MTDTPHSNDRICTEYEVQEVEKVNGTGKQPVVFVHGLWLLPNSWDPWREVFEEAGYATAPPGWPPDPDATREAKAHPAGFANKSLGHNAPHHPHANQPSSNNPA